MELVSAPDIDPMGQVSVPFRGSCSEMLAALSYIALVTWFPSPFGVRVLKWAKISRWAGLWQFPSPFGVRVLKFSRKRAEGRGLVGRVSVPFRGSCSEIGEKLVITGAAEEVSVPFRGSCSEMTND